MRPGAAFAVIEYDGLAVELCGAEYDTGPVVIEATQAGADPDVIEVFSREQVPPCKQSLWARGE